MDIRRATWSTARCRPKWKAYEPALHHARQLHLGKADDRRWSASAGLYWLSRGGCASGLEKSEPGALGEFAGCEDSIQLAGFIRSADRQRARHTAAQWFDFSCFSQPSSPFTAGTAPAFLSSVRTSGARDLDMSLYKVFSFGAERNLRFEVSSYNVTNSVQYAYPSIFWNPPGRQQSRGDGGLRPGHKCSEYSTPIPVWLPIYLLIRWHAQRNLANGA
jgi:hypothetical protein